MIGIYESVSALSRMLLPGADSKSIRRFHSEDRVDDCVVAITESRYRPNTCDVDAPIDDNIVGDMNPDYFSQNDRIRPITSVREHIDAL